MTKKFLIPLMACALLLTSCVSFHFPEPLPVGGTDNKTAPKALQGVWKLKDGTLTVDAKTWVIEKIDSLNNRKVDTLFNVDQGIQIKEWNGYYFFNINENNGWWTVFLGYQKNRHFFIKALGTPDIDILSNSIGLSPDSTRGTEEYYYKTPLTTKQMDRFIKDGGFTVTLYHFNMENFTLEEAD